MTSYFNPVFASSGGPIRNLHSFLSQHESRSTLPAMSREMNLTTKQIPVKGIQIQNPNYDKIVSLGMKYPNLKCIKLILYLPVFDRKNFQRLIGHYTESISMLSQSVPKLSRLILKIDLAWPKNQDLLMEMSRFTMDLMDLAWNSPIWQQIETFDLDFNSFRFALYGFFTTPMPNLKHFSFQSKDSVPEINLVRWSALQHLYMAIHGARSKSVLFAPDSLKAIYLGENIHLTEFDTTRLRTVMVRRAVHIESNFKWILPSCIYFHLVLVFTPFFPQSNLIAPYFLRGLNQSVQLLKFDLTTSSEIAEFFNHTTISSQIAEFFNQVVHCSRLQHLSVSITSNPSVMGTIQKYLMDLPKSPRSPLQSISFYIHEMFDKQEYKERKEMQSLFEIESKNPEFKIFQRHLSELKNLAQNKLIDFDLKFDIVLDKINYFGGQENPVFHHYLQSQNIFQHIDTCN